MSKPDKCKFCGGSSKLNVTYFGNEKEECFCACNKCQCQTAVYATPEEAIAAWNRKPEDEPITTENLEVAGFVVDTNPEHLNKNHILARERRSIMVEFGLGDPPLVFVNAGKMPYIIINTATTMQDIADLKRLFLGIEGEEYING